MNFASLPKTVPTIIAMLALSGCGGGGSGPITAEEERSTVLAAIRDQAAQPVPDYEARGSGTSARVAAAGFTSDEDDVALAAGWLVHYLEKDGPGNITESLIIATSPDASPLSFGNGVAPGSISGVIDIYTNVAAPSSVPGMEPTMPAEPHNELQRVADWKLNLHSIPLTSGGGTFASAPGGVTVTVGDTTARGTWEGAFRGDVANPTAADAAPSGVTGKFGANSDTVGIVGSFGATRQR